MADWAYVQGNNTGTGSGTSNSLSLGIAVTSGDIVVGAVLLQGNVGITKVTDDQNNAYDIINTGWDGAGGASNLTVGSFVSLHPITNNPSTVTINLTATSGIFWILLDEFTPPTGTTDICFNGATYMVNDTGATFPAFNTLDNDELIWCVSFATTTTTSPGTGFTAGQGGGTQRTSQWKIQSSPATVTPAFS